jgi:hypothetical protein
MPRKPSGTITGTLTEIRTENFPHASRVLPEHGLSYIITRQNAITFYHFKEPFWEVTPSSLVSEEHIAYIFRTGE